MHLDEPEANRFISTDIITDAATTHEFTKRIVKANDAGDRLTAQSSL